MKKTVLYQGQSELGRYQIIDMVYDGRPARMFYSGRRVPQSGVATDDEPELLFDYNQRFLEIAESIRPRSVLVIGGGVFTLPMALWARFDDMQIDAVEIDPLLPALARRYFDLPDDPRLRIIVDDGRHYIDACTRRYDLIVIDAFYEFDIPSSLLSAEAAAGYHRLLTPRGVLAMNFIARYHTPRRTLARQLPATFRSAFAHVDLYPADPHYDKRAEQNIILAAANRAHDFDYLQSAAIAPFMMLGGDVG